MKQRKHTESLMVEKLRMVNPEGRERTGVFRHPDMFLFGFLFLLLPWIAGSYSAVRTLVFAGLYAIAAVGLVPLIGYTGQVSLGHAGFFAVGAYASAILTTRYHVSPWLAMLAGLSLSVTIAYLVGMACLRLRGHYLVMATLGFGLMVNILLVEQEGITNGVMGIAGIPPLRLLNLSLANDIVMYYLIWGIALFAVFFLKNISRYRWGRALHRIRTSEVQAYSLGIDVPALKIRMFVLSAGAAALAGSLFAHFITAIGPEEFTIGTSMNLLIMVVIGGRFSPWGGVLGALLVVGLPQIVRGYESYSVAIFGILLIAVLMFFPGGLVAGVSSMLEVLHKWTSFLSRGVRNPMDRTTEPVRKEREIEHR